MSTRERSWPVPAALVALSAIPLTAGTLRLIQLADGPAVIPADHRFASFPLPLVVHIVGATTYALAGILQFVPRFRRRHLAWHRRAGRALAVAGLLVAISALWMTLFYRAQPGTGDLLYVLRLVFGSAMAACLVLGLAAVRRRDIAAHRAWMIRAYAIGLAAGTHAPRTARSPRLTAPVWPMAGHGRLCHPRRGVVADLINRPLVAADRTLTSCCAAG